MRPGPSLEKLSYAGIGVTVNVMRGRQVLATDIPVKNVREEWTDSRTVPSQITFTAPSEYLPTTPSSLLNNFGQQIQVLSLVETPRGIEEIEIGWFKIRQWKPVTAGIEVTGIDLKAILDENPMIWPSSPPPGATLRTELQRLCSMGEKTSLPVILEVPDRAIPRTFQWGTDRIESVNDLCGAYGLVNAVKPDRCLHAWDPEEHRKSVVRYTARDMLLDAPRLSTEPIPNVFTVVGGEEENTGTRVSATTTNFSFPYEPESYGLITQRTALAPAVSQAQVDAAAQTRMRSALEATETRQLEVVMDPRLEGWDVISVFTENGEPLTGRVKAYARVLDTPEKMRVDIEVFKW